MAEKPPHIAIVPTPGMGHLIPLIELAKRLVTHHGFTVTFIIANENSFLKAPKAVLQSLPPSIDSIFLPPVSFDDLPADTKIETMISLTVLRSLSHLRSSLELLVSKTRVVALVVDLFGTDAFDVAAEFGVAPYIFFTSTAMALSLFLFLPKLDEMVACEFRDMNEPVAIPGCVQVHGSELLDPVQDRRSDAYKCVLNHTKRYRLAEGIMVNSFMELEPGPLKALQTLEPGKPPVYPVGPLTRREPEVGSGENECLKWLDDQPLGSVLFVAFGSGGTLPSEQLNELALGLEMSEQRFLWVVRSPSRVAASPFFNSSTIPISPPNFYRIMLLTCALRMQLLFLIWFLSPMSSLSPPLFMHSQSFINFITHLLLSLGCSPEASSLTIVPSLADRFMALPRILIPLRGKKIHIIKIQWIHIIRYR
ncbi:unnamed protein product, partial [Vitis vinifera]